jgi:hypothetical protein
MSLCMLTLYQQLRRILFLLTSLLGKMPECGVVLGIRYLVHEFSLCRLVSYGMDDFPSGVKRAEREAYNYLREFHC